MAARMHTPTNCISHWFPKLASAGLPVPRTRIIQTTASLAYLLDGQDPPETEAWERFRREIHEVAGEIGYPLFLRSGHFSGKHSWRETCYVPAADVLLQHVAAIIVDGEMQSFFGFPWDTWAVRQLLETKAVGTAFYGEMPVVREVRAFVDGPEIECMHPYWPLEGCLDEWGFTTEMWRALDLPADREPLVDLASRAGAALGGRWSVDLLETTSGWYVTDVATADESWHWPGCERT